MNNPETEYGYSVEEWVEQSSPRPGRLWKHTPTGYWYFDRSDLMAFYDTGAQQWKIYDYRAKQWYVYSEALFFCQTPAVGGICQYQPSLLNIAGEWETSYGRMTFGQEGNNVSGTYYSGSGKITGTLVGNVLTGNFVEPKGPGRLEFTFSSDGNSFTGRWGWGSEPLTGTWKGTRVR